MYGGHDGYAHSPEEAAEMYESLRQQTGGGGPAPPEPPLSPSGHSGYTDAEFAAWDAAGRPSNHDYLRGGGAGYGGDDEVPDPAAKAPRSGLAGWFSRG